MTRRLTAAFACAIVIGLWIVGAQLTRNLDPGAGWRPHVESVATTKQGVSEVRAGVYVLSVGNLVAATGTYTVDMYVMLRCPKAPCEFGKWEFMNGRARSSELNVDEPLYKEYRIQADLQTPSDLRRYPFDSLPIRVQFEDSNRTVDKFRFVADPKFNGVDPDVNLAGWNLKGWRSRVGEHHYPHWDTRYSRITFELLLSRSPLSSILKSIVPALVIVVSGLLALILGPSHALQRVGIGTSALIGGIMFHINLTSQLPPIGYLTVADRFMLVNYVGLVGSLFATILVYSKVKTADPGDLPPDAIRVHELSRAIVPIVWLTGLVAVFAFST